VVLARGEQVEMVVLMIVQMVVRVQLWGVVVEEQEIVLETILMETEQGER